MKNNLKINRGGFTLIEVILYIALYGIVIGGVVVSVYTMFEANAKNQTKAMVQEEGMYLLGKIDWALTGATTIDVENSNQELHIDRTDIPTNQNPLIFDISNKNIRLARGTGIAQILNNTNTTVRNLVFTHTEESTDGITPESIACSFTLTALTPSGAPYSQDFSTTRYLKK